jgi:type IV pilus assembly protein PilV
MTGRDRGFTLVESLIALLLLSVGMLGAGGMLVSGLRAHADALRQVAATNLARDMADRIRANPRGRADYDTRDAAPGPGACDPALPCEPAQRAASDVADFIERAQPALPGRRHRRQHPIRARHRPRRTRALRHHFALARAA